MRVKNKRNIYIAAAAVVAAITLVLVLKDPESNKTKIETRPVERGAIQTTVSANGILQPVATVEVKSNVAGQLVQLSVDEGDRVKQGQVIAKIDPTDSMTALEQSQADLSAANSKVSQAGLNLRVQEQTSRAQLASARQALNAARTKYQQAVEQSNSQPSLTKSSIKVAESNLAAAKSAYKQTVEASIPQKIAAAQAAYDQAKVSASTAQKDLARQQGLLAKGFVAKSQVEAAEDKYAAAKAQLDTANNKVQTIKDETEQDKSSAQAKVDQAQAGLDNAKANQIQDKLKAQDVEAARAAVQQAESAVQVAQANLSEIQIRKGDIVQAAAQVTRSKAAVKSAATNVGYTTVVAPRSGIVTKKYAEVGSIVTAGKSSFAGTGAGVAIVDVADTSRMFALVNVDETDIAQIEIGQNVDIIVDAYPDWPFTGKVTKIAPQSVTDQNVTTIPVTVEVDLPDVRLKPGMNCTCDFVTNRKEDVLMVPNEAVTDTDNGSTVTVVTGKDKEVTRKVETGLVGNDMTEIKSGLREGDRVVTARIEPETEQTRGMGGGMRPGGFGGPGGMGGMRRR